jgi:hypothetical protein
MTASPQLPCARGLTLVFAACCALALSPSARAQDAQAPALERPPRAVGAPTDAAPIVDTVAPAAAQDPEDELSNVELRLSQLRHERTHILAPLTLVVTGYGAALIGMAAAFTTFAFAEQVQHREPGDRWRQRLDVNNDDSIDHDDEQAFRRMARSFAVIGGVGVVIGVVGTVLLAKALRADPDYGAELRSLRRRRRELRRQLEYGANAGPGSMAVTVRGRFF